MHLYLDPFLQGNVSVVAAILSILEEEIIYFNKQQSWKEKVQE